MVRIRIEIVAMIDRTAEIGSKKSITSQFEYDLNRILAGGLSNRISLLNGALKSYSLRMFFMFMSSCPFKMRMLIFLLLFMFIDVNVGFTNLFCITTNRSQIIGQF